MRSANEFLAPDWKTLPPEGDPDDAYAIVRDQAEVEQRLEGVHRSSRNVIPARWHLDPTYRCGTGHVIHQPVPTDFQKTKPLRQGDPCPKCSSMLVMTFPGDHE
jgi:hypothetical protein